jgi:hypothetical protein
MTDTVRLSDILAREVAVEWFEAVALVRDVADRVRENLAGRSVPELDQIELTADGRVRLSGAMETEEPVRRLGQLLQAALAQSDPPVQLRLTASQATAPTPAFTTVREYDEALAYYERPERERILQGLYQRAMNAPVVVGGGRPTLDEIAPLEHTESKKLDSATQDQRQTRRRAVPMFAGAVGLFIGSAALQYWVSAAPRNVSVSKLATTASDAVGTALVSGVSKVSEAAGLGRLAPVDSASVPAPALTPSGTSVPARAGASRSVKPEPLELRVFDLSPESSASLAAERADAAAPTILSEPALVPHVEADTSLYSAADPEVVPPVGVRPQLPAVLPADVRKDQLGRIELTILPDGTVGAVKLLSARRSVPEAMLLSAAKAWTFKPAMRQGRPVAYKKVVWLALR